MLLWMKWLCSLWRYWKCPGVAPIYSKTSTPTLRETTHSGSGYPKITLFLSQVGTTSNQRGEREREECPPWSKSPGYKSEANIEANLKPTFFFLWRSKNTDVFWGLGFPIWNLEQQQQEEEEEEGGQQRDDVYWIDLLLLSRAGCDTDRVSRQLC